MTTIQPYLADGCIEGFENVHRGNGPCEEDTWVGVWVVIAEPFGGSMKAEAAGLEGKVPANEVVDVDGWRRNGVMECLGNFKDFLFRVKYFWW